MLVLTRNITEKIIINGNITVAIADVQGTQVRLAIDAPPEITIDREEIHLKKQEQR